MGGVYIVECYYFGCFAGSCYVSIVGEIRGVVLKCSPEAIRKHKLIYTLCSENSARPVVFFS